MDVVISPVPCLALGETHADRQTFQVFTGAAGSGSSKNLEGLIGNVHALQRLRFSLLKMHEFDPDGAGNAD
jgi:hypothetical protein